MTNARDELSRETQKHLLDILHGYRARDGYQLAEDALDAILRVVAAHPPAQQPSKPDPTKYWQDMYIDLLKRVDAGEFAKPAQDDWVTA